MRKLDIDEFNLVGWHSTKQGPIDLAEVALRLWWAIENWSATGLITENTSFGCAITQVNLSDRQIRWNDPSTYILCVVSWGDDGDRYVLNAVRKLRATMRTGRDTLDLRMNEPGRFQDVVGSQEPNGDCLWGDYPWGGAVFDTFAGNRFGVGVSAYNQVQDEFVARTIHALIGTMITQREHPELLG